LGVPHHRARVPAGPPPPVVRHTETVHVTTRHTVVGADAPRSAGEPADAPRYADPAPVGPQSDTWSPPRQRQPRSEPARSDTGRPDPNWPVAEPGLERDAVREGPAWSGASWRADAPRWAAREDRGASEPPGERDRRPGPWPGDAEPGGGAAGWADRPAHWGDRPDWDHRPDRDERSDRDGRVAGRGGSPRDDLASSAEGSWEARARWDDDSRWQAGARWDERGGWDGGVRADGAPDDGARDDRGRWAAGPPRDERPGDRPAPAATTGWTGDRWAAVRVDDRGRELRMGERRAHLHADDTGAEVRVEDRWAGVREDRPGYDPPTARHRGGASGALPAAGDDRDDWLADWRAAEADREPAARSGRARHDDAEPWR
ncbi:MAG TPA: hypothetical protein VNV66_05290, partial [Pilimelia sp.]|nr:hypothetical protein [Pilimelia sp.]